MARKPQASDPASSPFAGERRLPPSQRDAATTRADVARYLSHHRLEEIHHVLQLLAVAVFGAEATVVAHLRRSGQRERLTFVVDAADPTAIVRYEDFLPREQAFWAAYAGLEKPNVPFAVAIRPARGWSRTEALAPMFTAFPFPDRIS